MQEKRTKKSSWKRRLSKWVLWVAGVILIILGVLLLITQTRPFKNWLRDYAVAGVNESLAGELSVGRLDGNLFSHIELSDVSIKLGADTVVRISSVRIRHDLWALLDDVIRIDSLLVDSPYVILNQLNDSVWNLARLIPADTAVVPPGDTAADEFGYDIDLRDLRIQDASASINALDSMVPSRIESLDIELSARYSTDQQYLAMRSLRLETTEPNIRIRDLTFEALMDTASLAIKDMILQTAQNRLTASASICFDDLARSTGSLRADSIDCVEFDMFLPSFVAALRPVVSLQASLQGDSLIAAGDVVSGRQAIRFGSSLRSVSTLVDTTVRLPLSYTANISLNRVALARWLDNPDLDVVLNGSVVIKGSGTDLRDMTANIKSDLNNCTVYGRPVSELRVDADYTNGDAALSTRAAGPFGKVAFTGNVRDILDKVGYTGDIDLERLDMGMLGFSDSLHTDLNLTASVDGSGTSLDSARGLIRMTIAPSSAQDLQIDRGFVSAAYSENGLRIDTMYLATSALTADLVGDVGWNKTGQLRYTLNLLDGSMLAGVTDSMLLGGNGRITGSLSGSVDSMTTQFALEFHDLFSPATRVAELRGQLAASYADSAVSVNGWVGGQVISTDAMTLDSLSLTGNYSGNNADVSISLYAPDGIQSNCELGVTMDSLIQVILKRLSIDYNDTRWVGGSDSTVITLTGDSTYTVDNLNLTSIAGDSSRQSLSLDGVVSLAGESYMAAVVENLELQPIAALYELEMGGKLSAHLNLSGMADNPEVRGKMTVTDGHYQNFSFYQLGGDLDYSDRRATFVLNFKPTEQESLTVAGTVPFAFTLADSSEAVPEDQTMDVRILASRLPLDVLKALGYTVEKAGGYLTLDLSVTNTLQDPFVAGKILVRDGSISVPDYGVNYQDVQAGLSLEPREIALDSLVIKENKGTLRVSGTVTFDGTLIAGNISASRIQLVAKDFYAVRHRHYEVQVSSDVGMAGTDKEPTFSGTLTVNRSRFYLPAFTGESASDALDNVSPPMLAVATFTDTVGVVDSAKKQVAVESLVDSTQSAFLDNLRGNLKITIPKNTWIQSPNLKLELAGDVEVVKEGSEFELFGSIRVVRGHYQLYGKRFTVKRGELVFQGGSDYVAALDIEADYVFRTATHDKKTLRLNIGGTSEIPTISFTLDNTELSEGDAVSYILFGLSLDELTQGQRSAVSESSGSGEMAGKVAAGLLAGQLSQALGNRLNLDVIEIKAQGDLQSAAVVIGKYLTPDLFMSYQRSFGSMTDDDLEPEKVTLEYQLTRLIYLQLTEGDAEEAGFDIIFKFQSR